MANLTFVSSRGTRWLAGGLLLLGSFCLLIASATEPAGSVANVPDNTTAKNDSLSNSTPANAGTRSSERLREGTRLVDVPGVFQSVGAESVLFTPKEGSKESLRVLQNLALDRIASSLEGSRGQRQGTVSGIITEYRGANYLLVTKVVFPAQDGETVGSK